MLFEVNLYTKKLNAKFIIYECKKNNIPIGEIKSIKEVFKSDVAKNMILNERVNSQNTQRVSSIAFKIS